MLKEGVFLGKRYEILSRIGSGGMADVYKGKDHKLNRNVAVKVLKSDYRNDKVFIQKFLTEAQAAAGLINPNVVNVYDVGQDRGLYYMVMELVEGITLKEYIEKKGRLSAKETLSIAIQMVTGIQAAHNQHIIHRDIKPQNIIISKEGKVKVTDFGIARATTSTQTISTSVMGSVHYTSPEQARGGIVDEKSDIYSAGITMYEMVTGHVPFDGDSTVSVALKHLQENIISPSEEVPDIPYSLECIIMKCTQKNPERRYHNCQTLIADLKHSLIDPEGSFVNMSVYTNKASTDSTVLMTESELEKIKAGTHQSYDYKDDYDKDYDDDDYDDDDYDDDDYDDDDYDDDDYDDDRPSARNKKNSSNNDTKKIMKILMIVAAVILSFTVIFVAGKALGLFKTAPNKIQEEEQRKVKVPDVRKHTVEEAKKILAGKNLGYRVIDEVPSDTVEEGRIVSQKPGIDERVSENTEIQLVVSSGKKAKELKVPDVKGMSEDEAMRILTDKKLVPEFDYAFSDDVDEGDVISTDPEAGTTIEEGKTVTVIICKGTKKVEVPKLVGIDKNEAENLLSEAGLVGKATSDYSSEYGEGIVISQKTPAGNKTEKGSTVEYVVSKGPKIEVTPVPDLKGLTEAQAGDRIGSSSLELGNVTYQESDVTKGYVISQSIAPGTSVEKGSPIDIVVSKGPKQPEPQEPDKPDKPENPTAVKEN